jgi:hypothetical protein
MPEDIRTALLRAAEEALAALAKAAAGNSNDAEIEAGVDCADALMRLCEYVVTLPAVSYSEDAVSQALNWAADTAQEITNPEGGESSGSIETDDAINLVVNLTSERLRGAGSAAEAIGSAYSEDIQPWHGWKVEGWPEGEECATCGDDIHQDDNGAWHHGPSAENADPGLDSTHTPEPYVEDVGD